MHREVVARISSAMSQFYAMAKPILANPAFPRKQRMTLAAVFILSRMLYNAGTWGDLAEKSH
eukprot:3136205-Alexandrium_andersonii.AAC.1